MRALSLLATTLLLVPMSGANADYIGEYGGWDVSQGNESCGAAMQFEGPGATELTVIKYADGEIGTLLTNLNWSAKDGELYQVAYILNGKRYFGESSGSGDYVRAGFVSKFGGDFGEDFARGSSMEIYLGEQRIDHLSLRGTAVAMQAVERCLVKVRSELAAAERERLRYADIPKDPFASLPPSAAAAGPARPQDMMRWAGQIAADYPSSALRQEESGTVGYTVTVDVNGRVSSCRVTESSGSASLDEAACRGATRYARFFPARNDKGELIEGEWSNRIRYTLPN